MVIPWGKLGNMSLEVPVVLLRFTHDSIDARLHFRNQVSIYKAFDELQREVLTPQSLQEPLDVVLHNGALSNRGLSVHALLRGGTGGRGGTCLMAK